MPPIELLPYFLLAMLVISATPGPDMLGILSYGVGRGRQAGMGFAVGVGLGTLFHTLLAVAGISAVVATSPWAFRFIVYAGASYLIYLGTRALVARSHGDAMALDAQVPRQSFGEACLRGFLCNALNPKVGLFFLAFLPQFIDAHRPAWSQLLMLGIVFWLWVTLSYSLLGYYSGLVGSWLRGRPSTGQWIDRVTGALFVGLGLHLIFTGQKSQAGRLAVRKCLLLSQFPKMERTMEPETIRKQSLTKAKKLGYPINPDLPLLGDIAIQRTQEELVDRMLCLFTCVACSYGLPKQLGWSWLAQEGLLEKVTPEESLYLRNKDESPLDKFQPHVETIWALAWLAQVHDNFEFNQTCTNDMVTMFPNLKGSASSEAFRNKCELRSVEEIAPKLDLAYCIHWAIQHETENQLELPKKPKRLWPYIIINRRHALEWLFCDEPWDEVPMDIDQSTAKDTQPCSRTLTNQTSRSRSPRRVLNGSPR